MNRIAWPLTWPLLCSVFVAIGAGSPQPHSQSFCIVGMYQKDISNSTGIRWKVGVKNNRITVMDKFLHLKTMTDEHNKLRGGRRHRVETNFTTPYPSSFLGHSRHGAYTVSFLDCSATCSRYRLGVALSPTGFAMAWRSRGFGV